MRKFSFDTSITKDIISANADSFLDNLKMIDISEIQLNKENFYTLSEIELLADDIERQGLKHNLVVSEDKDGKGYWLKSGHRRYSAIKLLVDSGRINSAKVPCYIDGVKSQSEAKLDLIMLNATQRKYTDAETMQEYEELERTFKQLDDEGKGLKGRMRENIAKVLNISPAQVGKMENIRHNAIDVVTNAVKTGEISISTANEVAKLPEHKQLEVMQSKPTSKITHKEIKAEINSLAEKRNSADISDKTEIPNQDVQKAEPVDTSEKEIFHFTAADENSEDNAADEQVKDAIAPKLFCNDISTNSILFVSARHKDFYLTLNRRCKHHYAEYRAVMYLIALIADTLDKIEYADKLFSFNDSCINPSSVTLPWLTSSTRAALCLAFSLWNGFPTAETSQDVNVYNLFGHGFNKYFIEAIKIRFL